MRCDGRKLDHVVHFMSLDPLEDLARQIRSEVPAPPGGKPGGDPGTDLNQRVVRGDRCARCCQLEAETAIQQIAGAVFQAASLGPGEGFAVEESTRGRRGAPGAGGRAPEGRPRAIPFGGGTGRAIPDGMEEGIPEGAMDDPLGVCTLRMGKIIGLIEKYADRLTEYYRNGGGCEDCCARQALQQGRHRMQFQLTHRGQPAGKINSRRAG